MLTVVDHRATEYLRNKEEQLKTCSELNTQEFNRQFVTLFHVRMLPNLHKSHRKCTGVTALTCIVNLTVMTLR